MFKRKKEEESIQYSVIIMTEGTMEDSPYEKILNTFDDYVENVGFFCNLNSLADSTHVQKIKARMDLTEYKQPIFVIVRIDFEEIKEKEKALEKKHKWKKFFDTIPPTEYIAIYDEVHTKPENIVFHTDHIEEAIGYLKKQEEYNSNNDESKLT